MSRESVWERVRVCIQVLSQTTCVQGVRDEGLSVSLRGGYAFRGVPHSISTPATVMAERARG